MARIFCLYCGRSLRTPEQNSERPALHTACSCNVAEALLRKLERQEQEHLAEYATARPLSPDDLNTLVQDGERRFAVRELLRIFQHDGVLKESAIRVTATGLIQLVYRKHEGSRLMRWPWV